MTYVIFSSHRSRDNTLRLFSGIRPTAYYSWKRESAKGIYALNDEQLALLKANKRIKGWRILRKPYDDLLECWNQ